MYQQLSSADIRHHAGEVLLTKEECYEIGRTTALTGAALQVPLPVHDLRFATQEQRYQHVLGFQSVLWTETPSGKELIDKV